MLQLQEQILRSICASEESWNDKNEGHERQRLHSTGRKSNMKMEPSVGYKAAETEAWATFLSEANASAGLGSA